MTDAAAKKGPSIFDFLREVDNQNIHFFRDLPDDEKKGFSAFMMNRRLSSGSKTQSTLVNAIVNPMVFNMNRHPDLMYKLCVVSSDGKPRRYSYIKKKAKDKTMPVTTELIKDYYQISKKDAIRHQQRFSMDEALELADDMGYDTEQIKKIKAEFK